MRMVVDLHGYPVWEAVEVATAKIREAWEKGFEEITLIHGVPDIYHHRIAWVVGRGGIKWRCGAAWHGASGASGFMPAGPRSTSSRTGP